MPRVSLPRTTHTLELAQLNELNAGLREHTPAITVADLGLEGVLGSAVLERLCWDGPPEYPYVHAHVTGSEPGAPSIVDLHTVALRELSRRLGLRQQWGA